MRGAVTISALARATLAGIALLAVGYLAVLVVNPRLREGLWPVVQWFGRPGSWPTIAIVTVMLMALGALLFRSHGGQRPGAPVAIVAGLAFMSLVLGLASYWRCHDENHPWFFTPLMWAANVVKGGTDNRALNGRICPAPTPVALEIARLSALAAIFLSVVGIALALFQSRLARLRVYFARSVTGVVDIDDYAQSMVSAIARTLGRRSTLAVMTASPDRQCVRDARNSGARIVTVDFTRPESLTSLPLWSKLDKLYLLSPDPATNLQRLALITEHLSKVGSRQRLPLIVRIDDPWQAAAWRAQHFGGAETRWAADAVGKYEVTARRLLDSITADQSIQRVVVCGTSRLTLALCADMAQRQIERDYYAAPGESRLPKLVLVADDSAEFKDDHEYSLKQLGLAPERLQVAAIAEKPSVPQLLSLITDGGADSTAVILVDRADLDVSIGTRLAARFPATVIYAWDPDAQVVTDRLPLVGQLRTYRLSMDMPEGQAQDAWERAARLIHDRYAAEAAHRTPAAMPWSELDEFYRGSNRRQVQNALWMVEKIGGHTWNTFGSPPDSVSTAKLRGMEPLEQLRLLGFDRNTALAMARAEHEDWCRYYRGAGWRHGTVRDDARKTHDKLVDWPTIAADPDLLKTALSSLAATLSKLRELGYRSHPVADASRWQRFRRIGTVIAEQQPTAWTWTTQSGHTMRGDAGDWLVRDPDSGDSWSVRDNIFRSQYEYIDGQRWRRGGTVLARPARDGETVDTLEGPTTASTGDWVVKGEQGEQWPVPHDEFDRRYEGPLPG
jgi:hypothetical protein